MAVGTVCKDCQHPRALRSVYDRRPNDAFGQSIEPRAREPNVRQQAIVEIIYIEVFSTAPAAPRGREAVEQSGERVCRCVLSGIAVMRDSPSALTTALWALHPLSEMT